MKTIIKTATKGVETKLILALFAILTIIAGFFLLYANEMLSVMLNDYLMVQNFDGFATQLLLTTGLFALMFGINTFNTFLHQSFEWGAIKRLSLYYIARLLRARQEFFISRPVAKLHADLWTASQATAGFLGNALSIVSRIVTFVFYGALVFSFDVWAGIFSVLALPVYFLFTIGVGARITDLQHGWVAHNGDLATVTQEAFDNVKNIKAKGVYSFFTERSARILLKIKNLCVKVSVLQHYTDNITGLIRFIAPILIIFGAIHISPDFDASAGTIMVLFINIPLFLGGLASIHKGYIMYKMGRPFLAKLMEFDNAEPEDESGIEITTFESLQTISVKVVFDGGKVVDIPDFKITNNEKVMFFGESGIGKSTVFNIIMGFNRDYDGEVIVNGINLRQISVASLRRVFGITFQYTNAITLDLRDNILLGAKKTKEELAWLIKLTALERQQDAKGETILNNNTLSGGERSRLGLSQMLAPEPSIMLIDEAFSNMDEELESKIINDLFNHYPDRTVICISHRNSSRHFFDKVIDFNAIATNHS